MFENSGHIHIKNPEAGAEDIFFVKNINFLSIWSFAASFPHLMTNGSKSFPNSNAKATQFDLAEVN